MNERSAAERATEACSAEQANELALLAKERADEPSTLWVVFLVLSAGVSDWRW